MKFAVLFCAVSLMSTAFAAAVKRDTQSQVEENLNEQDQPASHPVYSHRHHEEQHHIEEQDLLHKEMQTTKEEVETLEVVEQAEEGDVGPESEEDAGLRGLPYGVRPARPAQPTFQNIPLPAGVAIPPATGYDYGYGGGSAFGPGGSAFHSSGPAIPYAGIPQELISTVRDFNIDCKKDHMVINFKMSQPFFGFIYPVGLFETCILFVGTGETEISLTMSHDRCGAPAPPKKPGYSRAFIEPVMQHQLMVQWDQQLISEDDRNFLLVCDRPADYNQTVKFDMSNLNVEKKEYATGTHPGPQMWMEIQRGEGPTADALQGPVYLGETLTMVFTLADDVFRFDTNVIQCWASDGNNERAAVTWNSPSGQRQLPTQLPVIENACSVRPKLFGHFLKSHAEYATQMTTTQWAHFRAFRFPTTARVLIQCDVQVCYEKCQPLVPCQVPFDPRIASESQRKRRDAGSVNDSDADEASGVRPERLTMFRAIEVLMPESDDINIPMATFNGAVLSAAMSNDCFASTTFYGVVLGLGILVLLMIGIGAGYAHKLNQTPRYGDSINK